MMYGCVGASSGLPIVGLRKFTPSISSDPPLELDSVRGRRLAKFVYELLRAIFSFSACIPRMFGGVLWVGGGVGGTSPVIRTKASMPAHSSLSAVTGVRVNTSILLGDGGEVSQSSLDGGEMARPASADGFGGGGMMKVSAESCTDSVSMYVGDMTLENG